MLCWVQIGLSGTTATLYRRKQQEKRSVNIFSVATCLCTSQCSIIHVDDVVVMMMMIMVFVVVVMMATAVIWR